MDLHLHWKIFVRYPFGRKTYDRSPSPSPPLSFFPLRLKRKFSFFQRVRGTWKNCIKEKNLRTINRHHHHHHHHLHPFEYYHSIKMNIRDLPFYYVIKFNCSFRFFEKAVAVMAAAAVRR